MDKNFDLIVVGSGAAGFISAISAAKHGKKVLLVEKLDKLGSKLKATGGGKCNLTNTLDNDTLMEHFGRNGRFLSRCLELFDHKKLIEFFKTIGVDTHCPDGFRVFPITHNSSTILEALTNEAKKQNVDILLSTKVDDIIIENGSIKGIKTATSIYHAPNVILATGGVGFPALGTTGDGFDMVQNHGHKVTNLYPAMLPLNTKETWVANCTADTIAKATIKIDIKKHSKLKQTGDLIFTKKGLRGPLILDFSREVTPLLEKYGEVPVVINMTKNMNEDQILKFLKQQQTENPNSNILDLVSKLLPKSISTEILQLSKIDTDISYKAVAGESKNILAKYLSWTPFTIISNDGFDKAMVTRGGISLKQIDPNTMESKIIKGLYFAGEIVDIDGPCGGYNLQWSFSSGYLAAYSICS